MAIKEKDYKQILFLDLKAQGFIKSSQHQTCRSIYKEHNKIGLVFFWLFYKLLGIFKFHWKKE